MAKKALTFEEALAKLSEIVERLESGEGTLDDSLRLYEEGIGLVRACNQTLGEAEQKIKILQIGADGSATLADFGKTEEDQ